MNWQIFEELIAEATRVRDQVMPAFLALGTPGDNAVRNMRRQLDSVMATLLRRDYEHAARLVVALKAQRAPSDGKIVAGTSR